MFVGKQHIFSGLALFTSVGTLLCCALPALLVALGAGAALAGIVTSVPQLIWLSEYKVGLFVFSGLMLTFSGLLHYRSRHAPCPIDPAKAQACRKLRRATGFVHVAALAIYSIGFFFAFVAPYLDVWS